MRTIRAGLASLAVVAVLLTPSAASAQVNDISVGPPRLGPLGASVNVQLSFTCDTNFNVAFGDVNVLQVFGHKLAGGTGSFINDFPGVPCTGSTQTVTVAVPSVTSFAFKQGTAVASADVTVYNPVTSDLITEFADVQATRIRR